MTSEVKANYARLIHSARVQDCTPDDFKFIIRTLGIAEDFYRAVFAAGLITLEDYLAVISDTPDVRMRTQMNRELLDVLGAQAHTSWSGWMKYLFKQTEHNPKKLTEVTLPKESVERWDRQMNTDYDDLPEDEQRSDRAEAIDIINVLERAGYVIVKRDQAKWPEPKQHGND